MLNSTRLVKQTLAHHFPNSKFRVSRRGRFMEIKVQAHLSFGATSEQVMKVAQDLLEEQQEVFEEDNIGLLRYYRTLTSEYQQNIFEWLENNHFLHWNWEEWVPELLREKGILSFYEQIERWMLLYLNDKLREQWLGILALLGLPNHNEFYILLQKNEALLEFACRRDYCEAMIRSDNNSMYFELTEQGDLDRLQQQVEWIYAQGFIIKKIYTDLKPITIKRLGDDHIEIHSHEDNEFDDGDIDEIDDEEDEF